VGSIPAASGLVFFFISILEMILEEFGKSVKYQQWSIPWNRVEECLRFLKVCCENLVKSKVDIVCLCRPTLRRACECTFRPSVPFAEKKATPTQEHASSSFSTTRFKDEKNIFSNQRFCSFMELEFVNSSHNSSQTFFLSLNRILNSMRHKNPDCLLLDCDSSFNDAAFQAGSNGRPVKQGL
jgi:hypothetical protein